MNKKLFVVLSVSLSTILTFTSPRAQETPTEEWKSHVELSYARTDGNSDTESLAGKFEAKKTVDKNRYSVNGNIFQASTDNKNTASKYLAEGMYDRFIQDNTFAFLTAGYIRDKFSGYEYRLFGGPGLGYVAIKTEKHSLETLLAVLFFHDKFIQPNELKTDDYSSGKVTGKYEWKILENFKFKELLDYSISFKDTDKYFVNSATSIENKISNNLSLGFAYILNYQAKPPAADLKKTDNMFLATLIVDF